MEVDDLSKLRAHVAALRRHEMMLDADLGRGKEHIGQLEFEAISRDLRDADRDVPGVLRSFTSADFVLLTTIGVFTRYNVAALLRHVASAVARLEALLTDPRPDVTATRRGFLSHVATDHDLAEHFRVALEAGTPGVTYFMASKSGAIPSGDPWCKTILDELKRADRFLVLLTPASVERLWVGFESGGASMTGRPLVPLAAGGLLLKDIPTPFSELQVLSLDGPQGRAELLEAFNRLGCAPPADPDAFLATAQELARRGLPAWAQSRGTESVALDHGRFLAWGEGLDHLQDEESVSERSEFTAALHKAGIKHFSPEKRRVSAAHQVFLTDLRRWKREIGDGFQVLAVHRDDDSRDADAGGGGWRGVQVGHDYYAWDGPLNDLADREPVELPLKLDQDLKKALDDAGANPAWQNKRNPINWDNARRIFVTDRRTYRRAIINGNESVLVARPIR
jgi:hypothetical protein